MAATEAGAWTALDFEGYANIYGYEAAVEAFSETATTTVQAAETTLLDQIINGLNELWDKFKTWIKDMFTKPYTAPKYVTNIQSWWGRFAAGFVYGVVKHYVQQAVYEYLEEKYGDELNPVLKQVLFSVISSIATEFTLTVMAHGLDNLAQSMTGNSQFNDFKGMIGINQSATVGESIKRFLANAFERLLRAAVIYAARNYYYKQDPKKYGANTLMSQAIGFVAGGLFDVVSAYVTSPEIKVDVEFDNEGNKKYYYMDGNEKRYIDASNLYTKDGYKVISDGGRLYYVNEEGLEIDIKDEQLKNGSVSLVLGNSGFYSRGQGVVKKDGKYYYQNAKNGELSKNPVDETQGRFYQTENGQTYFQNSLSLGQVLGATLLQGIYSIAVARAMDRYEDKHIAKDKNGNRSPGEVGAFRMMAFTLSLFGAAAVDSIYANAMVPNNTESPFWNSVGVGFGQLADSYIKNVFGPWIDLAKNGSFQDEGKTLGVTKFVQFGDEIARLTGITPEVSASLHKTDRELHEKAQKRANELRARGYSEEEIQKKLKEEGLDEAGIERVLSGIVLAAFDTRHSYYMDALNSHLAGGVFRPEIYLQGGIAANIFYILSRGGSAFIDWYTDTSADGTTPQDKQARLDTAVTIFRDILGFNYMPIRNEGTKDNPQIGYRSSSSSNWREPGITTVSKREGASETPLLKIDDASGFVVWKDARASSIYNIVSGGGLSGKSVLDIGFGDRHPVAVGAVLEGDGGPLGKVIAVAGGRLVNGAWQPESGFRFTGIQGANGNAEITIENGVIVQDGNLNLIAFKGDGNYLVNGNSSSMVAGLNQVKSEGEIVGENKMQDAAVGGDAVAARVFSNLTALNQEAVGASGQPSGIQFFAREKEGASPYFQEMRVSGTNKADIAYFFDSSQGGGQKEAILQTITNVGADQPFATQVVSVSPFNMFSGFPSGVFMNGNFRVDTSSPGAPVKSSIFSGGAFWIDVNGAGEVTGWEIDGGKARGEMYFLPPDGKKEPGIIGGGGGSILDGATVASSIDPGNEALKENPLLGLLDSGANGSIAISGEMKTVNGQLMATGIAPVFGTGTALRIEEGGVDPFSSPVPDKNNRASGVITVEAGPDGRPVKKYEGLNKGESFVMTAVGLNGSETVSVSINGKDGAGVIEVNKNGSLACKDGVYCLARKEDGQVILAEGVNVADLEAKLDVKTKISPLLLTAILNGKIVLTPREAKILRLTIENDKVVLTPEDNVRLALLKEAGGEKAATFSGIKSDPNDRSLRFVPVGDEEKINNSILSTIQINGGLLPLYLNLSGIEDPNVILNDKSGSPKTSPDGDRESKPRDGGNTVVSPVIMGYVNELKGAFEFLIGPGDSLIPVVANGTLVVEGRPTIAQSISGGGTMILRPDADKLTGSTDGRGNLVTLRAATPADQGQAAPSDTASGFVFKKDKNQPEAPQGGIGQVWIGGIARMSGGIHFVQALIGTKDGASLSFQNGALVANQGEKSYTIEGNITSLKKKEGAEGYSWSDKPLTLDQVKIGSGGQLYVSATSKKQAEGGGEFIISGAGLSPQIQLQTDKNKNNKTPTQKELDAAKALAENVSNRAVGYVTKDGAFVAVTLRVSQKEDEKAKQIAAANGMNVAADTVLNFAVTSDGLVFNPLSPGSAFFFPQSDTALPWEVSVGDLKSKTGGAKGSANLLVKSEAGGILQVDGSGNSLYINYFKGIDFKWHENNSFVILGKSAGRWENLKLSGELSFDASGKPFLEVGKVKVDGGAFLSGELRFDESSGTYVLAGKVSGRALVAGLAMITDAANGNVIGTGIVLKKGDVVIDKMFAGGGTVGESHNISLSKNNKFTSTAAGEQDKIHLGKGDQFTLAFGQLKTKDGKTTLENSDFFALGIDNEGNVTRTMATTEMALGTEGTLQRVYNNSSGNPVAVTENFKVEKGRDGKANIVFNYTDSNGKPVLLVPGGKPGEKMVVSENDKVTLKVEGRYRVGKGLPDGGTLEQVLTAVMKDNKLVLVAEGMIYTTPSGEKKKVVGILSEEEKSPKGKDVSKAPALTIYGDGEIEYTVYFDDKKNVLKRDANGKLNGTPESSRTFRSVVKDGRIDDKQTKLVMINDVAIDKIVKKGDAYSGSPYGIQSEKYINTVGDKVYFEIVYWKQNGRSLTPTTQLVAVDLNQYLASGTANIVASNGPDLILSQGKDGRGVISILGKFDRNNNVVPANEKIRTQDLLIDGAPLAVIAKEESSSLGTKFAVLGNGNIVFNLFDLVSDSDSSIPVLEGPSPSSSLESRGAFVLDPKTKEIVPWKQYLENNKNSNPAEKAAVASWGANVGVVDVGPTEGAKNNIKVLFNVAVNSDGSEITQQKFLILEDGTVVKEMEEQRIVLKVNGVDRHLVRVETAGKKGFFVLDLDTSKQLRIDMWGPNQGTITVGPSYIMSKIKSLLNEEDVLGKDIVMGFEGIGPDGMNYVITSKDFWRVGGWGAKERNGIGGFFSGIWAAVSEGPQQVGKQVSGLDEVLRKVGLIDPNSGWKLYMKREMGLTEAEAEAFSSLSPLDAALFVSVFGKIGQVGATSLKLTRVAAALDTIAISSGTLKAVGYGTLLTGGIYALTTDEFRLAGMLASMRQSLPMNYLFAGSLSSLSKLSPYLATAAENSRVIGFLKNHPGVSMGTFGATVNVGRGAIENAFAGGSLGDYVRDALIGYGIGYGGGRLAMSRFGTSFGLNPMAANYNLAAKIEYNGLTAGVIGFTGSAAQSLPTYLGGNDREFDMKRSSLNALLTMTGGMALSMVPSMIRGALGPAAGSADKTISEAVVKQAGSSASLLSRPELAKTVFMLGLGGGSGAIWAANDVNNKDGSYLKYVLGGMLIATGARFAPRAMGWAKDKFGSGVVAAEKPASLLSLSEIRKTGVVALVGGAGGGLVAKFDPNNTKGDWGSYVLGGMGLALLMRYGQRALSSYKQEQIFNVVGKTKVNLQDLANHPDLLWKLMAFGSAEFAMTMPLFGLFDVAANATIAKFFKTTVNGEAYTWDSAFAKAFDERLYHGETPKDVGLAGMLPFLGLQAVEGAKMGVTLGPGMAIFQPALAALVAPEARGIMADGLRVIAKHGHSMPITAGQLAAVENVSEAMLLSSGLYKAYVKEGGEEYAKNKIKGIAGEIAFWSLFFKPAMAYTLSKSGDKDSPIPVASLAENSRAVDGVDAVLSALQ